MTSFRYRHKKQESLFPASQDAPEWGMRMKNFAFIVHNNNGLDARLSGMLVKEAIACEGNVRIRLGDKKGNAKMIFNVLSLHARKGDCIELTIDGGREEDDAKRIMHLAEQML